MHACALRNIRSFQKSDGRMLPEREFQSLVSQRARQYMAEPKILQCSYYMLQEVTETHFVRWMMAANLFVVNRNSKIITTNDFNCAKSIMEMSSAGIGKPKKV